MSDFANEDELLAALTLGLADAPPPLPVTPPPPAVEPEVTHEPPAVAGEGLAALREVNDAHADDSFGSGGSAKRRLAVMKSIQPLMVAMIVRPGLLATAEEKRDALKGMMKSVKGDGDKVAVAVFGDSAPSWVVAQSREICAQWVAQNWSKNGLVEQSDTVEAVCDVLRAGKLDVWVSKASDLDYARVSSAEDGAIRIRLSILKAVTPLFEKIENFAFGIDPQAMQDVMLRAVLDAADQDKGSADASADLVIACRQGHIGRAASLISAIYDRYAQRATSRLAEIERNASKDEADKWLKENAVRYQDAIVADGKRAFMNLVTLVDRLVENDIEKPTDKQQDGGVQ